MRQLSTSGAQLFHPATPYSLHVCTCLHLCFQAINTIMARQIQFQINQRPSLIGFQQEEISSQALKAIFRNQDFKKINVFLKILAHQLFFFLKALQGINM